MKKSTRKNLAIFAFLFMLAAALAGMLWHHLNQRRTLPFPIVVDPVVGRRIYSSAVSDPPPPVGGPRLHDWQVIGDPLAVSAEIAAELREILSSPSTYTMQDSKCFEPGMAVTFGDGADRVDVLICLLCNRAVFYRNDGEVGRCLSDEGNKRLTSIYRRLFGALPPQM